MLVSTLVAGILLVATHAPDGALSSTTVDAPAKLLPLPSPVSATPLIERPAPPAPRVATSGTKSALHLFEQRAVRFTPGSGRGPWFAPVMGETIRFVLPSGKAVSASDALAFVGRNDMAERRREAVAFAPWTNLTGIFGSFGVMAAVMATGGAAGYLATNQLEGALLGTLIGTFASAVVALPMAYVLPRIPTTLSPTELEVVDAVRKFNLSQARALGVDVVDIPFAYLGPT